MIVAGLVIGGPMLFLLDRVVEKAAIAAGFSTAAGKGSAREAGITSA